MTAGLLLMRNLLTLLAKSGLALLGLTAGVSATDASIQKKNFRSETTAQIISNEEMNDIMKMVKSLEESGLLIKRVGEAIKNVVKKADFLVCC